MLTKETVEHIAHLARLSFSEAEIEDQLKQLDMIIDMMDILTTIDTEGVPPLNHVLELSNVYREDEVQDSLPREEALANGPEVAAGMFQVPKIV
ncbi:Asp-tRNA(Asn)/Glu-tRNA(Gln) amidotransferase subunit GatC [Peptococcus simiae]|uniref:Aspartyl/glutamyl-tRNA(Asn/Gln) amidotransferase subunit C n=1 Tax=Peptococcus simiae TaxID=1643805 RepID=A0ABW9GWV1_9FIRM